MAIIRWRPFHEIDELVQELEYPRFNGWDLAVDVYEDENNVIVEMHVPGIDPDKVSIEVEDNYLKICGMRDEKKEIKDKHFYKKEIRRGSFERIILLPCPVEEAQAQAEFKEGVLKVLLPKAKGKKPSKIKITKK